MDLFQTGSFLLHSGKTSDFKIECDALSDEEIAVLAYQLSLRLPRFHFNVYGVPEGGIRLALAMEQYSRTDGRRLVCDDVFTTGKAIQEYAYYQGLGVGGTHWIGAVLFARNPTPAHIYPLFQMGTERVPGTV